MNNGIRINIGEFGHGHSVLILVSAKKRGRKRPRSGAEREGRPYGKATFAVKTKRSSERLVRLTALKVSKSLSQ